MKHPNPEAEFFELTASTLSRIAEMAGYAPELRDALEFLEITPDELRSLAKRHTSLARFMYQTGEVPQPEAKMGPIEDDDHHMTMADFIDACESGCFIDYDGHGVYATATEKTDINVYASDVGKCRIDPRWSHVVWYNR
jgi:hypothetical protein